MITKQIGYEPIEIVCIDAAKEHSRITDDDDDDDIQDKLDASHDLVQQWLNRKLQPTNMIGVQDKYISEILLPFPPINEIIEVSAEDPFGEVIIIPDTDYIFDDVIYSLRIKNMYKKYTRFRIQFICGYDTDKCPKAIQHAIKMTFATLFEMREDAIIGTQINSVPVSAKNIIKSFRVRSPS